MTELLPFFVVLFAGLFFSEVFNRLHLPWVVALILAGIIIGPNGLEFFEPNSTLNLLGQIGLVFLMFMAGLETQIESFKKSWRGIEVFAILNGIVPFAVGFGIGYIFGFDLVPSLLIGTIFISSSIAVVIPSLESTNLLHTRLGKSIVAGTMIQDVTSLVLLSILFQSINPITALPLYVFYPLLIISLLVLRWAIPKVRLFFSYQIRHERDIFQQELRAIFVILIGTVIVFQVLGLHPIIAGFFAGLVLSDSITSRTFKDKLRTFSYGLFIPFFFILVGAQADIGVFFSGDTGLLVLVVVVGSLLSKFLSGWLGGRANGFSSTQSALIGSATIPQLSTTLAVVFTGFEAGLLSQDLVTAMVILSIVTTFASPLLVKFFAKKTREKSYAPIRAAESA